MTEPKNTDWLLVVLAILASIIAAAQIGKVPPALPLLRVELGLSIVQAGWVISIIAAMAMVSGMAAGMVADRIGHRRLLFIGLAVVAASSTAGSFAQGAELILVGRFLEGIGFITIAVSAPPLIMTSTLNKHRQVVLGIWSAWMPAGISLSMFLSPLILGPFGWRALWLFWAVLAIALALAVLGKGIPVPEKAENAQSKHSFIGSLRLIMSRPGPMIMAVIFCVFAAQWGSIMAWIPSFLVEQRGLPVSSAAILGGFVVLINAPGNMIGGWLVHRNVERTHLIVAAQLIMGLSAIGIFSDVLPDNARYGLALLFSLAAGLVPSAMFASVPLHAPSPQHFGATSGLLLQGSNVGNFFGPPAVAAIVAAMGAWNNVMWIPLGCSAVGVILGLSLLGVERRQRAAAS